MCKRMNPESNLSVFSFHTDSFTKDAKNETRHQSSRTLLRLAHGRFAGDARGSPLTYIRYLNTDPPGV